MWSKTSSQGPPILREELCQHLAIDERADQHRWGWERSTSATDSTVVEYDATPSGSEPTYYPEFKPGWWRRRWWPQRLCQKPQRSRLAEFIIPAIQSQPKSTTPDPSMISPPITPMSSGMGNSTGMSTPTTPGTNQQYHTPPSPTSPGLPDPNASGQKSRTMTQSNSTGGDNHNDPDFDPYADQNQVQNTGGAVPIQAQAQFSIQVNSPVVGHGNGNWDPSDPNNFPSQHSTRSNPSATCRLSGCDNPVFVDPVTRRAGEYCSQRHREDAAAFGQASPCIMCQKMPRGQKDHFCSRACREKALRP